MVTAVVAVLMVATLFIFKARHGSESAVTAGELLARARIAEEAIAARPDQVLHRTINLEERKLLPGAVATGSQLVTRRRIEVWQSDEKGITARRLYDENGALVAGEWRKADGSRTVYHHGPSTVSRQRSVTESEPEIGDLAVWQFELSAKDFSALPGSGEGVKLEEGRSDYVVSFARNGVLGVTKAVLVLNRDDLHARELTLFVGRGDGSSEYRFIETSFERRSTNAVAPYVFDPDPEFIGPMDRGAPIDNKASTVSGVGTQPVASAPVLATAAMEVEVLRLLNSAGADLGEQVSVTRNPAGELRVEGIVETEQRKHELLIALAPLAGKAAVKIQINTVAEVLARQRKTPASGATTTVEPSDVTANTIPVDSDLRHYFASKGLASAQTDDEVRRFAMRIRNRSQNSLMHAYALKRLVNRFSPDDVTAFDPEARKKWLALISQHAQAVQRETQAVRDELQPIFLSGSGEGLGETLDIRDNADLTRAVERLFELCSANDKVIRSAFSISPDSSKASALRASRFWSSLKSVERFAARMQSVK
jgi:hypothetical protein